MIIFGDIHGRFSAFSARYEKNTTFISVGDFGVYNDREYELIKLNELFANNNNMLYICRGNHDDQTYFNEDKLVLSNIIFVKDQSILTIENKKIAFYGGAVSLDRSVQSHYTGKDEQVQPLTDKFIEEIKNGIDMVITHSFHNDISVKHNFIKNMIFHENDCIKQIPKMIYKLAIGRIYNDRLISPIFLHELSKGKMSLKKDIIEEKSKLEKFFNVVKESSELNNNKIDWYYGHFHPKYEKETILDNITAYCLPILHFKNLNYGA